MGLRVVHINKELTEQEAAAKILWEQVLQPKWDAKLRAEAEEFFKPKPKKGGTKAGKKPLSPEGRA